MFSPSKWSCNEVQANFHSLTERLRHGDDADLANVDRRLLKDAASFRSATTVVSVAEKVAAWLHR